MPGRFIFSPPVVAPSPFYDAREVDWDSLAALTRLKVTQQALESTFVPLQPSSTSVDQAEGRGWEIVWGSHDDGAVRVWNDRTLGAHVRSPRPRPRGLCWPKTWFDGRMEAALTAEHDNGSDDKGDSREEEQEEARSEDGPEDEARAQARAVFTTPPSGRSSLLSQWSGPSTIRSTPSSRPHYSPQRVGSKPMRHVVEKILRQARAGVFEAAKEEPMLKDEKPAYFHQGVFRRQDVEEALVDDHEPHPKLRLDMLPRAQVSPRYHDLLDDLERAGKEDMSKWFEAEFGVQSQTGHPTSTTPQGSPPMDPWALINGIPSTTPQGSPPSNPWRLINNLPSAAPALPKISSSISLNDEIGASVSDARGEEQGAFPGTEGLQDVVQVRMSPIVDIDGSVPPLDSRLLPPLNSLLLVPFLLEGEVQARAALAPSAHRLEESVSMPSIRTRWATDSVPASTGQVAYDKEAESQTARVHGPDEAREVGLEEPKLKSILVKKRTAKKAMPSIAESGNTPPQPKPKVRHNSTQTETNTRTTTTTTTTTKSTGTARTRHASTPLTSLGSELAEDTVIYSPQVTDLFLELSGGRTMCYNLYGDQDGMPVIFLHGMSQSRLTGADLHEDCRRLKMRLICPDRPGYGRSSPPAKDLKVAEKIQQCVDDLACLAVHLQLGSFAVLGDSAGAIIALAAASKLEAALTPLQTAPGSPKPRLAGLSIMSCPSPKELGTKGHRLLKRLAWNGIGAAGKIGRKALRKVFGKESREKLRLTSAQVEKNFGLDPEDFSANLAVGFTEMRRREPWVQGEDGLFADIEMMIARGKQAWGFDVAAVDFEPKRRGSSIQFWHGRDDMTCLSTRTRKLCAMIKGAEFHELPGLDHQTVLLKGSRILEGLLSQL